MHFSYAIKDISTCASIDATRQTSNIWERIGQCKVISAEYVKFRPFTGRRPADGNLKSPAAYAAHVPGKMLVPGFTRTMFRCNYRTPQINAGAVGEFVRVDFTEGYFRV